MSQVLAYLAGGIVGLWGLAHAIPTRNVLAGFDQVSTDNRRIVLQEWLAEAFTMWATAAAIIVATFLGGPPSSVAHAVYGVAAGLLVALAILTSLTGARTPVVWFKVCPVRLGSSAALLVAASLL